MKLTENEVYEDLCNSSMVGHGPLSELKTWSIEMQKEHKNEPLAEIPF